LRALTKLNWKLIILLSLLGTLVGAAIGTAFFFLFPGLSNFNVEDYIIAVVLLNAILTAAFGYRRAVARKAAHALFIFTAICILTLSVFILMILSLIALICAGSAPCSFFPFL